MKQELDLSSPEVENFICPISHTIMLDPIIVVNSQQTYERSALVKWFTTSNKDPLTLIPTDQKYIDNIALRNEILNYLKKKNITPSQLKAEEKEAPREETATSLLEEPLLSQFQSDTPPPLIPHRQESKYLDLKETAPLLFPFTAPLQTPLPSAPEPERMVEYTYRGGWAPNRRRQAYYDFMDKTLVCLKIFCSVFCKIENDNCVPCGCLELPYELRFGARSEASICVWLGSLVCTPFLLPVAAIACVSKNTCCLSYCQPQEQIVEHGRMSISEARQLIHSLSSYDQDDYEFKDPQIDREQRQHRFG